MHYNGKEMNLREFIAEQKKEYEGLPPYRWDEGIVWAMEEYYSSMGEFSDEDWEYIKEANLLDIAVVCEEDYEQLVNEL